MKKIFIAMALCFVCAVFTGCESELEKQVRKEYFAENIVPGLTIAKMIDENADVKIESVKLTSISNIFVYTESDMYKYVLDTRKNDYINSLTKLVDEYILEMAIAEFIEPNWSLLNYDYCKAINDSTLYFESKRQYDSLSLDKTIKYKLGFFEIKTESKVFNEKNSKVDTISVVLNGDDEFVALGDAYQYSKKYMEKYISPVEYVYELEEPANKDIIRNFAEQAAVILDNNRW